MVILGGAIGFLIASLTVAAADVLVEIMLGMTSSEEADNR
jgi:hypothetical protein